MTPSAVLDTNVVLDWLVFADAQVAPLVQAVESRRLRWLATATMRRELAHMLAHASLQRWSPNCEQALAVFDAFAESCADPAPSHLRCSDADDQGFIDLAVARQARWLLTHDRALLKLARRAKLRGVQVLTPAAWAVAAGP
ncbi:MAG: putative toxin-antitoxin system toxin component, PIN family [Rubrivivax sp.]